MPQILVENTKIVTIKIVTRILVMTSDRQKSHHKNIIVTKFDALVTNLIITKTLIPCSVTIIVS
jgi:hypothetical protein